MGGRSTRQDIIEAADTLFYQRGFEHTSFADIAETVGISRGNFYYHFKTKDEILDAVIAQRVSDRQQMLDRWQVSGQTPSERVRSFIQILTVNHAKIRKYGCPIGTLFLELSKLSHDAEGEARELFDLFRIWLRRQFELMGRHADADALAMHILARTQGVATLANAYPDEGFLESEVEQMCAWLDAVADAPDHSDAGSKSSET